MFNQKVCVVTGGASGMGREISCCFGSQGARVAIIDRNKEAFGKVVADIISSGGEAFGIEADVTDSKQVNEAFRAIEKKYGGVDILVNCAGVIAGHFITEIPEDEWDQVIDINLKGTFLCIQAALRIMLRHSTKGKIINIASIAGKRGSGGWAGAHYAASKGGVIALTRSVARQVAAYGINVNAVAPGPTETPLIEVVPDDAKESIRQSIPMGRLGKPQDVANAVLFLAADDSEYIHGEVINVDGGITMD